jgi:hypothetical protein
VIASTQLLATSFEPAGRRLRPVVAEPDGLSADGVEHRRDRLAGRCRSGREHLQLAALRRRTGAEDGRVDEHQAVLAGELGERPDGLDADRRHLRPDLPLGEAGGCPVHDRPDVVGVAQHRDDDVGAPHRVGRLGEGLRSLVLQPLRLRCGAVPHPQVEAGGEHVVAHARAHDPGAEQRDGRHVRRA